MFLQEIILLTLALAEILSKANGNADNFLSDFFFFKLKLLIKYYAVILSFSLKLPQYMF